jgi:hypothetical protein
VLPNSPHPSLSFSAWIYFSGGFVDRCEMKEEKAKLVLGESFFFSTVVKHFAQEEAIASRKGTASSCFILTYYLLSFIIIIFLGFV